MIPAEAVEAAARVMAPAAWGPRVWQFAAHGENPADARNRVQQESLDDARAALEAAAPHMLARVSTLYELAILEPGTVLQGPDFHEETYKCTAPGTFHAIASPTEYRPSELLARGPFTVIYRPTP